MRAFRIVLVAALWLTTSFVSAESVSLGTLVTTKDLYNRKQVESVEVRLTGEAFQKAFFGDRYSVLVQDPSNRILVVRLDIPGPLLAKETLLGSKDSQVVVLHHLVFHRGWFQPSLSADSDFSVTEKGNEP